MLSPCLCCITGHRRPSFGRSVWLAAVAGLLLGSLAMAAAEITVLKDLHLTTTLVAGGAPRAAIVSPPGSPWGAVAVDLRDRLRGLSGVDLAILAPGALTAEHLATLNLVVLGNAADNDLVRRLYWQRWLYDTWFPGDSRHVVRSIHDPFGHGTNVIFLGGENAAAVSAAAASFVARLQPGEPLSVGWVMAFEGADGRREGPVSAAELASCRERAAKALEFKNGRNLISMAAAMARRYYETGQDGWAEAFLIAMRAHRDLGEPGMGTHMNVYDAVSRWDAIEESPVFSDADRLFVTNHFLYILRSEEGCQHGFFRQGTRTAGVRHNHQTLPGLAGLFGGRYVERGYGLAEAAEWQQAARALFESQAVSHKPQCDCNCYEWTTLDQTGTWALASGDERFFSSGVMRAAAERALLQLDNRGYSAANGDFWTLDYFPQALFEQAAAYYRDGRYEWAMRRRYAGQSGEARRGVAHLVRDLEPVPPTDMVGIRVAPMSPQFYAAPQTTMPGEPVRTVPLERSFDKIAFRGGLDSEDEYLLLDGIGCGSHGHVDANGIAQFSDHGRIWLMDVSYTEAPSLRDHNAVTVLRDGLTSSPPPLADLDPSTGLADLPSVGFTKTSLLDYSGVDWHRQIAWVKGRYVVVLDELVAREAGEYTLRSHWRTPGAGRLEGLSFAVTQQAKAVSAGEAVQAITRPDAEGDGRCIKWQRGDAVLSRRVALSRGAWSVVVVGCGHHSGDDSFHLHLDGRQVGDVFLSREKVSPSSPVGIDITADGEHEIGLSLRESPGTICDRVILTGPEGQEVVIDAFDLEATLPAAPRVDTFALHCLGADKGSLVLDTDQVGKWFKPYPWSDPVVSIVQFTASRALAAGARHCLAAAFAAGHTAAPSAVAMRPLADGVVLVRDGDAIACLGIGPARFRLGASEVSVQAGQFMLAADRVAVRAGTALDWRGALVASAEASSVEVVLEDDSAGRRDDLSQAWSAAEAPASAPPAPAPSGRPLEVLWSAAADTPVLSLAQDDRSGGADEEAVVALGGADGSVRCLDGAGRPRWSFTAGGPVNSVAFADLDGDGRLAVIAGSDDRRCYALHPDGRERWHFEGEAGDDPYWSRYWKAGEVEKVLAADLDGDGRMEVLFAAANMNVHACSPDGQRLWRYRQYGICSSLVTADLEGTGRRAVLAGPATITCVSTCALIDAAGKVLSTFGNDGWSSALTALAVVDLDGSGRPVAACGTNKNNLYALTASAGKLAQRWKASIGDVVTCLAAARLDGTPKEQVVVGSASDYVYVLDGAGAILWRANLHEVVQAVWAGDLDGDGRDEVVAVTDRAVVILDTGGRVIASHTTASPIRAFAGGQRLLVGCEDGQVLALRLR
ncbi:MAG: hypothetical protein GX595_06415 [Lentisphaerae bacterium]|nr:hypothetical protein [Lentisphaerota bacterium]